MAINPSESFERCCPCCLIAYACGPVLCKCKAATWVYSASNTEAPTPVESHGCLWPGHAAHAREVAAARLEAFEEAAKFLESHRVLFNNLEPYYRVAENQKPMLEPDATQATMAAAIRARAGGGTKGGER